MILLFIRRKFTRDFLGIIVIGTVYNALPLVLKLPSILWVLFDFSYVPVVAALIFPALQVRTADLAKKRYSKLKPAEPQSSDETLKRINNIATALLAPLVFGIAAVLLTAGISLSEVGIGLLLIVAVFMIYHLSEQTYQTTFAALSLNVLAFAVLMLFVIFAFVLKGQILLIPFVVLGLVPAGIAYVAQLVITKNLYRTRFDNATARFVLRLYSILYWSFFLLVVALMDGPMVFAFFSAQDYHMMLWWCAGFTPFVLGMYFLWGSEAGSMRMWIEVSTSSNAPAPTGSLRVQ